MNTDHLRKDQKVRYQWCIDDLRKEHANARRCLRWGMLGHARRYFFSARINLGEARDVLAEKE